MASNYQLKHEQHIADRLSAFKAEVHAFDMTDLLGMEKRLSKQLLTGGSLALITIDNQGQAIRYLEKLIAEREEEQRKSANVKKATEQSAEEYVMEVLSVSRDTAVKMVKEHGDVRLKFAGTALVSNTDVTQLEDSRVAGRDGTHGGRSE